MTARPHLTLQCSNLLLVGCRGQETVHLALQGVIHLHINVIAGRLFLIGGVHAAHRPQTQNLCWEMLMQTDRNGPKYKDKVIKSTHIKASCLKMKDFKLKLVLEHMHTTQKEGEWSTHSYLIMWLIMMGSGCCSRPASFMGISENLMRGQPKIWRAFG